MRISSRSKVFITIYFLVCAGIFLLGTAHWKQVNDPAQLSYLCFLMDHGMAPYRDLLEINMPGIYLANWSVMHVLGEGSLAWRIFDFSLMGAAAWAMIVIARPYDWLAGVLGATLFALFHGRDGAGQAGQRDFIIAVLLLCAYAFLFEFFRHRREWTIFAFGLCAGMAATIKPTPLPFIFLILVLAAMRWKRTGERILRPSLYALLGLLVPFAIVGAFLVSKHSVGSFWYLLRVELPFYKSLGRLPFPALMSSGRIAFRARPGADRFGHCVVEAAWVELGNQIAGRRNYLRHRVIRRAGKGLSLPSLSAVGLSLPVGGIANRHRFTRTRSGWHSGCHRICLRADPSAFVCQGSRS